MAEAYFVGGDALQPISDTIWAAQSFIPREYHYLEYVDVDFQFGNHALPIDIEIRPLKLNGDPETFYIDTSIAYFPSKPKLNSLNRLRFLMHGVQLFAGYRYCVILKTRVTPTDTHSWQYDSSAAGYPRGQRLLSLDSGNTWIQLPTQDHMFAEWGYPQHPYHPLPVPPVTNFACMDMTLAWCNSTVTITLSTIDPCHLTCYHTFNTPGKHKTTRIERGLAVPWNIYICFVRYLATEQNEAGDTLIHTFTIPNWPLHVNKWFTFRGTVQGTLSPSCAPIFQHTPDQATPFQNGSFTEWPDPLFAPSSWYKLFSGLGTHDWIREEVVFPDAPYAAKVIADRAGSGTWYRQIFCAQELAGKTVRFSAWGRAINFGTIQFNILGLPPAHFSYAWGAGPPGWWHPTYTRTLAPNQGQILITVGIYAPLSVLSTGIWDKIIVEEI